jgi:hypothetical protein
MHLTLVTVEPAIPALHAEHAATMSSSVKYGSGGLLFGSFWVSIATVVEPQRSMQDVT